MGIDQGVTEMLTGLKNIANSKKELAEIKKMLVGATKGDLEAIAGLTQRYGGVKAAFAQAEVRGGGESSKIGSESKRLLRIVSYYLDNVANADDENFDLFKAVINNPDRGFPQLNAEQIGKLGRLFKQVIGLANQLIIEDEDGEYPDVEEIIGLIDDLVFQILKPISGFLSDVGAEAVADALKNKVQYLFQAKLAGAEITTHSQSGSLDDVEQFAIDFFMDDKAVFVQPDADSLESEYNESNLPEVGQKSTYAYVLSKLREVSSRLGHEWLWVGNTSENIDSNV